MRSYFNLKGLPGTKEVPKPKGEGVMRLNPAWKALYRSAFKEARIILFMVSTSWLDSPNCHEEFSWLIELIRADPEADKEVFFWVLDDRVLEHPNWAPLNNQLKKLSSEMGMPEDAFEEVIMPFVTQDQQNDAIEKVTEHIQQHCRVWPKGAKAASKITGDLLERNFKKGLDAGIPGFG